MDADFRFERYLPVTNTQLLQPMARVWGGKGQMRKDACIAAIIKGLSDPTKVQSVLASSRST